MKKMTTLHEKSWPRWPRRLHNWIKTQGVVYFRSRIRSNQCRNLRTWGLWKLGDCVRERREKQWVVFGLGFVWFITKRERDWERYDERDEFGLTVKGSDINGVIIIFFYWSLLFDRSTFSLNYLYIYIVYIFSYGSVSSVYLSLPFFRINCSINFLIDL